MKYALNSFYPKWILICIVLILMIQNAYSLSIKSCIQDGNIIVLLINNSNDNIVINGRFVFGSQDGVTTLSLKVFDKEGHEIPYKIKRHFLVKDMVEFVKLNPGYIAGIKANLYDIIKPYCLDAGEYKAQVIYNNKYGHDKETYVGRLYSNEIEFIVNPQDQP